MIGVAFEMPVAKESHESFELFFEQTITDAIRDLLGESSMRAVLYHVGMDHIGADAALFHQRLTDLLDAPASIIEEIIIKDLFKNLDVLYVPKGAFDFVKYATSAREAYASREKRASGRG